MTEINKSHIHCVKKAMSDYEREIEKLLDEIGELRVKVDYYENTWAGLEDIVYQFEKGDDE